MSLAISRFLSLSITAVLIVVACARPSAEADRASHSVVAAGSVLSADSVGVLLAAGDIAMCTHGATETARLLDKLQGDIIVVGDAAYPSERDPNPYLTCYDSTWGRHKKRTHPTPGNHDVEVIGMYFDYFGAAAGARPGGYYSFDVGRWHVLALNSNIEMGPRSPQGRWAAADLAAHRTECTLAYMHHPRFSSGPHQLNRLVLPMWRLLDSAGVDVVVSGHDHIYERFAPMGASGTRDDRKGVRLFIAGTGGAYRYEMKKVAPNSEARSSDAHGILELKLTPGKYTWRFVPTALSDFTDSGSGTCH